MLVINKATAVVTLGNLAQTYRWNFQEHHRHHGADQPFCERDLRRNSGVPGQRGQLCLSSGQSAAVR